MRARRLAVLATCFLFIATPTFAAPLFPEIRARAGVGFSPDQFVVGAQTLLRSRLFGVARLAPSVDVGFGDDVTLTIANLDLLSKVIPLGSRGVGIYGGGGIGLAFFDSDSEFGVNLVGGADFGKRFFAEARFGMDDMPDLRLLGGIRLAMK